MLEEQSLKVEDHIRIHNSFNPRKSLSKSTRILLKLYQLPIVNKFSFLKNLVHKKLGFLNCTEFNRKFSLTSGNIFVGKNVSLADTFFVDYAPVFIGDNVSFSYKNIVITSTHDINDFNDIIVKPVIIKDNVWITTNVTILPGVTIGPNSIIGAGSVVTKDIPAGCLAAGNPCKVIKNINFKK